MRVPLETIAFARSGDKGGDSNVGVVARNRPAYEWMLREMSAEFVKRALSGLVRGEVERYEIPGILALNFVLHDSLGGGGSASLLTDAQGKTHAQALLRTAIEVPAELVSSLRS
jgi:hypothetical protein